VSPAPILTRFVCFQDAVSTAMTTCMASATDTNSRFNCKNVTARAELAIFLGKSGDAVTMQEVLLRP